VFYSTELLEGEKGELTASSSSTPALTQNKTGGHQHANLAVYRSAPAAARPGRSTSTSTSTAPDRRSNLTLTEADFDAT
jgi:hypothetical protein